MRTEVVDARDPAAISRAVELLCNGQPVAVPTETVYGLAADALNPDAVLRIFEAKERPRFDPLIVHLPNRGWLDHITVIPDGDRELATTLIERFWPGPLTLVVPKQQNVPDMVTAGLNTVAVRLSSHSVLHEILVKIDRPLAAPSANRFGKISPTDAAHVLSELEGRVPMIVDGGPAAIGVESTVIALRNGRGTILRKGPITAEELSQLPIDQKIGRVEVITSPGQLPSHYAPRTPMQLVRIATQFVPAHGVRAGLLQWRDTAANMSGFAAVRVLSPSGDLQQAAANLFRMLRELDSSGVDLIIAEEVPDHGLGAAIMDRLRRAAAR